MTDEELRHLERAELLRMWEWFLGEYNDAPPHWAHLTEEAAECDGNAEKAKLAEEKFERLHPPPPPPPPPRLVPIVNMSCSGPEDAGVVGYRWSDGRPYEGKEPKP